MPSKSERKMVKVFIMFNGVIEFTMPEDECEQPTDEVLASVIEDVIKTDLDGGSGETFCKIAIVDTTVETI